MKQLKWLSLSIIVLALLLGAEAVNAYMMYGGQYAEPYYPSRNYYMMDYYANRAPYGYYAPYTYAYGYPTSRGFFTNYYNDPNWKYYTMNTFMRGPRYGSFS